MKKVTIIYSLLAVFLITGWVSGLVKLCKCDFEPSYKAEVIYGIGTITGLNAFIGWFDFGK